MALSVSYQSLPEKGLLKLVDPYTHGLVIGYAGIRIRITLQSEVETVRLCFYIRGINVL